MTTAIYFVLFHFTVPIEIDLFEGERILNVHPGGEYKQVFIEGTVETREKRYPAQAEDPEGDDRMLLAIQRERAARERRD